MYSKFFRLLRFSSKTNSIHNLIYNLLSLQYDTLIIDTMNFCEYRGGSSLKFDQF